MMNIKIWMSLLCLGWTTLSFGALSSVMVSPPDLRGNDMISDLTIDTTPTSTDAMNAVCSCPYSNTSSNVSSFNNSSIIMD